MARRLESSVQKRLLDKAKGRGWYAMKTVGQSRDGFPDVFLALGGKVILVEVKTDTGKPSKAQEREIRSLDDHGVETWLVRGDAGVDSLLVRMEEHEKALEFSRTMAEVVSRS